MGYHPSTIHTDMEKDDQGSVVRDDFAPPSPRGGEAPTPHLHAKTFLAITSMGLIYVAQLVSLVGAGAVSFPTLTSFNLICLILTGF